jgi:hypothetical protein
MTSILPGVSGDVRRPESMGDTKFAFSEATEGNTSEEESTEIELEVRGGRPKRDHAAPVSSSHAREDDDNVNITSESQDQLDELGRLRTNPSLASFNFPFASSSTLDLLGRDYGRQDYTSWPSQTPSDDGGGSDDDSDPDSNPLYILLSTGVSPHLRQAWETAKVILVPPRRTLPIEVEQADPQAQSTGEPGDWERFVGLHALAASKLVLDSFVGYGEFRKGEQIEVRLDVAKGEVIVITRETAPALDDPAPIPVSKNASSPIDVEKSVHIVGTPDSVSSSSSRLPSMEHGSRPVRLEQVPPRSVSGASSVSTIPFPRTPSLSPTVPVPSLHVESTRTLKILSETTVYRRPKPPVVPQTPLRAQTTPTKLTPSPSPKNKVRKDKIRLRAPKWLRPSGTKEKEKEKAKLRAQEAERSGGKPAMALWTPPPALERLRVLSVDGAIVNWPNEEPSLEIWEEDEPSPTYAAEDGDETERHALVPLELSPPPLAGLSRSLSSASNKTTSSRGRAASSIEMSRNRSGFSFSFVPPSVVPHTRDLIG